MRKVFLDPVYRWKNWGKWLSCPRLQGENGYLLSHFSHVWLFVTPWTVASGQVPLSTGFSSKNAGVGCHSLLQGIFLMWGSNPSLLRLLHCRRILYQLNQQREGTSLQSLWLALSLPESYNGLKGTVGDGRAEVKTRYWQVKRGRLLVEVTLPLKILGFWHCVWASWVE